ELDLRLADIAADRLGRGNHLQQRPEELHVEVLLGPAHGAVVELPRGQLLKVLFGHRCCSREVSSRSCLAPPAACTAAAAALAAHERRKFAAETLEVELAHELSHLQPLTPAE